MSRGRLWAESKLYMEEKVETAAERDKGVTEQYIGRTRYQEAVALSRHQDLVVGLHARSTMQMANIIASTKVLRDQKRCLLQRIFSRSGRV